MGELARAARSLMERAADAGMQGCARLICLTPREIDLELRALAAQRRQQAEALDLAAWLTGRYVLAALHAPRRYPRRPDGLAHPARAMSDEQIKGIFINLAKQRREQYGHSGNPSGAL